MVKFLICELLLQALLERRQVRRFLAPQRHSACQVLFAISDKTLLNHGTQAVLFGRRRGCALRAGIDMSESEGGHAERERQAQWNQTSPSPTKLHILHKIISRVASNIIRL